MFGEVDACYNTVTQKDLDRFIDFKKVIHPIWAVEVQTRMLTLLAPAVLDGDQTAEGVTGKGKKDNEDEDEVSLGIEVEYAKDILEVFMKMELPAPTAKPTGQDHAGQAGEAAKQAGEENEKTASDVKMEIDVSLGVAKTMAAPAAEAAEQPGAPPLADSVQPPEEKPSAEAAAAAGDSMTAAPSLADSAPAKEQPSAEAAAAAGDPMTTPAAPSLADSAPEAENHHHKLQSQPQTPFKFNLKLMVMVMPIRLVQSWQRFQRLPRQNLSLLSQLLRTWMRWLLPPLYLSQFPSSKATKKKLIPRLLLLLANLFIPLSVRRRRRR